jgi:hypothetical protein
MRRDAPGCRSPPGADLRFFTHPPPVSVRICDLLYVGGNKPARLRTQKRMGTTMSRLAVASALFAALAFTASSAEAGHGLYGHSHGTFGISSGYYHSSPSHHGTYHPTVQWHDTTHVDVVPGRWVVGPYGMYYQPPRRVLHVDGHYDTGYPSHHHHHAH